MCSLSGVLLGARTPLSGGVSGFTTDLTGVLTGLARCIAGVAGVAGVLLAVLNPKEGTRRPSVGVFLADMVGIAGMVGIGGMRCLGVLRLERRAALLEVGRMKLGVLGEL